jgi:hypothetical protein
MNACQRFPPAEAENQTLVQERIGWFRRLRLWIATRYRARTDYYAAAAIYQQLSRLSDVELQRRGYSRATLARQVVEARERLHRLRRGA